MSLIFEMEGPLVKTTLKNIQDVKRLIYVPVSFQSFSQVMRIFLTIYDAYILNIKKELWTYIFPMNNCTRSRCQEENRSWCILFESKYLERRRADKLYVETISKSWSKKVEKLSYLCYMTKPTHILAKSIIFTLHNKWLASV